MTTDEFDAWIPDAVTHYAAEHVQAGNVSPETAHQWATAQFDQLLPEGTQTQDHHLLIVEETGAKVGMLWLYIPGAGNKRAFVYNIEVEPPYRGQGLGRSAMLAGEEYARRYGAEAIGLHVFGHNGAAMHLYEALGYQVTSANMVKSLS